MGGFYRLNKSMSYIGV